MISAKLLPYVAGVAVLLALGGLALWQANGLMQKGVELGRAEAEVERLRLELDTLRGLSDSLSTLLERCNENLREAVELGEAWQARVAQLEARPPRERVITIESRECVEALVEGNAKLIEAIGGGDAPHQPNS